MDSQLFLNDELVIPQELASSLRAQLAQFFPKMVPGKAYSVEQMCGKDYWNSLIKYHKLLAGKAVVAWEEARCIPIQHAPFNFSSPYPKKYVRRER